MNQLFLTFLTPTIIVHSTQQQIDNLALEFNIERSEEKIGNWFAFK